MHYETQSKIKSCDIVCPPPSPSINHQGPVWGQPLLFALTFNPSSIFRNCSRTSLSSLHHLFSLLYWIISICFSQGKKVSFDRTTPPSSCPFLCSLKSFQFLFSSLPLLNPSSQACPHHSGWKWSLTRLVVTSVLLNVVVTSSLHCSSFSSVWHSWSYPFLWSSFFTWLPRHIFLVFHLFHSLSLFRVSSPWPVNIRKPQGTSSSSSLFLFVILSRLMALNAIYVNKV